eukprot:1094730-Pelagomonas_calceolata.AAC.1
MRPKARQVLQAFTRFTNTRLTAAIRARKMPSMNSRKDIGPVKCHLRLVRARKLGVGAMSSIRVSEAEGVVLK